MSEKTGKYRFALLVLCVLMCAAVCSAEVMSRSFSDAVYVFVPERKEFVSREGAVYASAEPGTVSKTSAEAAPAVSASDVPDERKVCINTASADELSEKLPGIGAKKAQAIVEYRELVGGFDSVDELTEVNGIGEKMLDVLRPYCIL